MNPCLIAIGSNTGNRRSNVARAITGLQDLQETRVDCASQLVETRPVGDVQGAFLNGCLLLETRRTPLQLMDDLLGIENALGRSPRQRGHGDREIDLDILLYGEAIVGDERATIPHPRMSFRRFVLEPAAEIAACMRHPVLGSTVAELLAGIDRSEKLIGIAMPAPRPYRSLALPELAGMATATDWSVQWITPGMAPADLPEMNLLIESGAPVANPDDLSFPAYRGPRWRTGIDDAERFLNALPQLTTIGIESMQPLPLPGETVLS